MLPAVCCAFMLYGHPTVLDNPACKSLSHMPGSDIPQVEMIAVDPAPHK